MLSKLAPQFRFDLLEVQRCQARTRATVDPRLIPDDVGPQGFRESAHGLTQIALEELDNG